MSYLLSEYTRQAISAINCESTVATAAPLTPIGITLRKNKSPPMLSTTDIPKNISGVNESPIDLNRAAQTL